jgi:hypothetical protein
MRRRELLLVFFLAFSLFIVISSAFIVNTDYNMGGVISGGGDDITGAYNLKLAVGQPVVGTTSDGYRVCFGFFCLFAPIEIGENTMNFTGQLEYSTGKHVKNSLIRITIKNESTIPPSLPFERSKENTTDNFGQFFVKFENLPTQVMDSNLNITIRVIGEVEAIYECYYKPDPPGDCVPY